MRVVMVGQRGVHVGEKGSGVERHVAELAPRLVELGYDVTVFCQTARGVERDPWFAGVRLRYVSSWLRGSAATLSVLMRARAERPDVVHFHAVHAGFWMWFARRLMPRATMVLTYHGHDEPTGKLRRRFLHWQERVAVRGADYCIAVSHYLQTICRARFGVQAIAIPNGAAILPAPSSEVLRLFQLEPRGYVLAVARHVPQKGLHELVTAFRSVPTQLRLVIVGASAGDEYERELHALALQDARVQLVGYQEGTALAALFAHAYCFVHPSHAEGLSVAVLEAMSYGVPPVVAAIPANLEAIAGAGFSFPVGDVTALQTTLAQVFAQPARVASLGTQARQIIAEQYSWQRCVERTAGVYVTARH